MMIMMMMARVCLFTPRADDVAGSLPGSEKEKSSIVKSSHSITTAVGIHVFV